MIYTQVDNHQQFALSAATDDVKSSISSSLYASSHYITYQINQYARYLKKLSLASWYAIIIGIIIIVSFTPFYNHTGNYDEHDFNARFILHTPAVRFYMACSAIIAISAMMFFEFLIEIVYGKIIIIDSWERLLVAACMIIPRLFYIIYPNSPKKLFLGYCFSNAFNATRMFVNIFFGCRIYPDLFPPIRLGITYAVYLFAITLKSNIVLLYPHDPAKLIFVNAIFYISVLSYIYHVGRFIYKAYYIVDQVDNYEQNRYLICILHILMPAALVILLAIMQGVYKQRIWNDGPEDYMTANYLADALITVFFTLIPGHVARRDALETHRLLDMKRVFVRFVSHEIRSPLNVVVGGMNILLKLLAPMKCDNEEMFKEVMSLGKDIQGSCMSAIDILNDLLNYEKMDAGVFEVLKSYSPVSGIFEKSVANWRMSSSVKDISVTLVDLCNAISVSGPDHELRESHVNGNGYCVNIDRRSIEIVLRNLITNAVKFTPSGGEISISFSIELGVSQHGMQAGDGSINTVGGSILSNQQQGSSFNSNMNNPGKIENVSGMLRVVVRDSGAGIAKENVHKLFGQFTQFDSATLQGGGGSGLGLWICHKIIMMHEGIIYATSDGEGTGSSFVFELPVFACDQVEFEQSVPPTRIPSIDTDIEMGNRQQVSPTHALQSLTPRTAESFWNEVKQMTFLVVDDSPMSRKMLIKLLQTEIKSKSSTISLKFIQAEDGDIAVEKLRENLSIYNSVSEVDRIDCVLIDNVMVNMNGPEAVRIMRGELKYGGLIIGITGNALREDLDYFQSCGCEKALPKPFQCEELFMVLEHRSITGIGVV